MKNHTLPGYESNAELHGLYREVFPGGAGQFFTFMSTPEVAEALPPFIEQNRTILDIVNERPPGRVLEIGCGEGRLAYEMASTGSQVLAVDYVESAIASARAYFPNGDLRFESCGAEEVEGRFETVVLSGTLEHFDEPFQLLEGLLEQRVEPGGRIVTSSPSFLNPRGMIWMTLALLVDAPVSLSDRHFLFPWEFEDFSRAHGLSLRWTTCDLDWACGRRLLEDFSKRIPNVVRDAQLPGDPARFLAWLEHAISELPAPGPTEGATAIYELATPG